MILTTADQLFNAGFRFAQKLKGRETICLTGVMGSGKTHFVKGCCYALHVAEGLVTSPSFTLINHYTGDYEIAHIDLYRLTKEEEFDLIGGYDLIGRMICFIEWPDLIRKNLPKELIDITISIDNQGNRILSLAAHP